MWYRLLLPPFPQENQAGLGRKEESVMWTSELYEDWQVLSIIWWGFQLTVTTFFSKDSLRFEAIESFLQRKTSKLLTDFCVLHTKWVRIIKHFLGWVYFSRIIVHLQLCDPEKLSRGHIPALWNIVAVGIPCQLANNQREKCLFFPNLNFLNTGDLSIASKGSVS